jgi:hypothetical protein
MGPAMCNESSDIGRGLGLKVSIKDVLPDRAHIKIWAVSSGPIVEAATDGQGAAQRPSADCGCSLNGTREYAVFFRKKA